METRDDLEADRRMYPLDIAHECPRCGRQFVCVVDAYLGPNTEHDLHYSAHPQESFCDECAFVECSDCVGCGGGLEVYEYHRDKFGAEFWCLRCKGNGFIPRLP